MKKLFPLLIIFIFASHANANDKLITTNNGHVINKKNCTITLSNGNVYDFTSIKIVEHFPDIKVQLVDHFADINIVKTSEERYRVYDYGYNCYELKLDKHFGKLKVQIVEHFPDIKVTIKK